MKRFWPALCLIAFGLLRAWQLWSYDYAVGRDAYWYIIQAQSLLQIGELHASAWTPLHHVVAAVMYVSPEARIAMGLVQFTGWILTVSALMLLAYAFSGRMQYDAHVVARSIGAGSHSLNCAPLWWLLPIALSSSAWFFALQYPAQLYSFAFYVWMLVCMEFAGRAVHRSANRPEPKGDTHFGTKPFRVWIGAALVCALLGAW
ncbi:MAG: hypothetical protein KDK34_04550, partial [Leptospiraceae bacterium]|nr:hypothetical protein [Leptospiraceae bacterium]